jgi:hypothetical protein
METPIEEEEEETEEASEVPTVLHINIFEETINPTGW